jgi:hypothetical protein
MPALLTLFEDEFTPLQLPGIQIWLDADDSSSFTWDPFTETFSAWTDKKRGRVFTPVAGVNPARVIRSAYNDRYTVSSALVTGFGLSTPSFDIATMFGANGKDHTIFMAIHTDDIVNAFGTVFWHYISLAQGHYFRFNNSAGNLRWLNLSSSTHGDGSNAGFVGEMKIICLHRSGDTISMFVDGELLQTKTSVATAIPALSNAIMYLFCNNGTGGGGLVGACGDLIFSNVALGQADRTKAENFLANKYIERLA